MATISCYLYADLCSECVLSVHDELLQACRFFRRRVKLVDHTEDVVRGKSGRRAVLIPVFRVGAFEC